MGRFYNGDIEGKFWFAVQSSDDADNFGVTGTKPEELNYYFEEKDLNGVQEGINLCVESLGKYKKKLDLFFKDCEGYNDKMIAEKFDIKIEEVKQLLIYYARLELGEKIKDCIIKDGSCSFTAEC